MALSLSIQNSVDAHFFKYLIANMLVFSERQKYQ